MDWGISIIGLMRQTGKTETEEQRVQSLLPQIFTKEIK